jgi:hypothetical protein
VRPTTYQTWILPSSCQLGFLHLTIHVRGQIMLIKCWFAIIVMVDTIYSASSRSSLKFPLAVSIVHHVPYNTLISTQTMPHFSQLRSQGGTWEFHLSLLLCIIYICVCICFWLISLYLWLVLVFLFNRVYYEFTPLWHYTSQHPFNICLCVNKQGFNFIFKFESLAEFSIIVEIFLEFTLNCFLKNQKFP